MHRRPGITDDLRFGSSSGGSSPAASPSGPSDSDGSSTDECCPDDPREFRRHVSRFRPTSPSSSSALSDVDCKHLQRMVRLLPAFSSTAAASAPAARADALRQWLAGFDVGWVLDMGRGGSDHPRREVARRIRAWAQALVTMDRAFRRRANDAAAAELAAESVGVMLRLAGTVATLASSPSKLLAVLDVYAAVSETCPGLAGVFSWAPSHPVSAASDAALAGLVDASQRCVRDLRAFIHAPQYPWRMPQGGEVHPCVGFWMGYFRCMLRNGASLHSVLAGGEEPSPTTTTPLAPDVDSLVMELISCLEAALEEKSVALAFPGLRQVFMLNNTSAIVRSDLGMLLPVGWVRAREERMEGYIEDYLQVSWAPVVSRLDGKGKPRALSALRRRWNPLRAFYSAFEKACSMQRCWKVPSPVLRGDLRIAVTENVMPAYRRYLDDHPGVEVPAGRGAEELQRHLSAMFKIAGYWKKRQASVPAISRYCWH